MSDYTFILICCGPVGFALIIVSGWLFPSDSRYGAVCPPPVSPPPPRPPRRLSDDVDGSVW